MSERVELRRLLVIGGSDSSGGAGIQGDIKTGAAMGVDVSTAVTAITAQNSLGVQAIEPVPIDMLRAQLSSVCSDIPPHAVKLGMLYDSARVNAVADAVRTYKLRNVVCDPVLVSTSGSLLLDRDGSEALLSILPLFALLTPNAVEAAALTGKPVTNSVELLAAGRALLDRGANAVLLKGGHLGGEESTDILLQKQAPDPLFFCASRIETRNDHGTGCALATSIASGLALGMTLPNAVASGCDFVRTALKQSAHLWSGSGRGSMNLLRSFVDR
jgi:hydroxymethylpyrimidine/phosphomethylpyrimidine kinase